MARFKANEAAFATAHGLMTSAAVLCSLQYTASAARAEPQHAEEAPQTSQDSGTESHASFIADVCQRIEKAAQLWNLPPAFFARLIWKESRFDPNAVSLKGASGIAQFMPGTAQIRGLDDPFDPRSAIPESAHYLSDLRDRFGNLGLAAAAYNAGPNRVRNWRGGRTGLPRETHDFVVSITGFSSRDWNGPQTPNADYVLDKKLSFMEACSRLPIRRFTPQFKYASAPWQPWGVHLTSAWSPTMALSHYSRLQRKHPGVLAGRDPMVLRVTGHSMGKSPRFKIQIGQPSRARAMSFCKQLRQAGGVCIVYKTRK